MTLILLSLSAAAIGLTVLYMIFASLNRALHQFGNPTRFSVLVLVAIALAGGIVWIVKALP